MRSHVLKMQRSRQAERDKFSILVNELERRFEVIDYSIEISEQVSISSYKGGFLNHTKCKGSPSLGKGI